MLESIDYSKVGLKMKKLRKEKGITQEHIATDLGTTIAFVSNVENNRTKMNLRVLIYYANLLDVSIDYLLTATSEMNEDDVLNKEILRLANTCSTAEKEKIIKMIKILKK